MKSCWLVVLAACGGGGGFPSDAGPDAPPPGGKFMLSWTVTDTNDQMIPCNQVGAQVVSIALRNRAVVGGSTEAFTCGTAMGTSDALLPGTYDMQFSLTGLVGTLASAPPQQGIEIKSNQTVALQPVTFAVDATGGLELSVSANLAGGNCGSKASGGAGITATTITLKHAGSGTCEPVTFQISAGATQPAGMYTVNCGAPMVGPCIEADQKLTVQPVPSGNYQIAIRGREGATECWTNDDTLVVPPLSKVLKSTLNFGMATTPGC